MKDLARNVNAPANRRSFLKQGLAVTGAATAGIGLVANAPSAFAQEESSGRLNKGDAAILRFLAAAEIIESDLWVQYNELGGVQDSERPELGGGGSVPYMLALQNLDGDMPQYIHDNTDDELSHRDFLNAYLASKGADTVNLDHFRTIPGSKATGATGIGRLTNLMELTVDTSWWTRYRSNSMNPDLGNFKFPQAVPSLFAGQFPAIPRNDSDLAPSDHIQAIANTAAFHFGFIEQGGSSLYPSLAQRVSDPEVLRILLSIGPTETSHFQTWHDKAGNGVQPPFNVTDSTTKNPQLVFPNLNDTKDPDTFQANLIMPEPVTFLSRKFPPCSIIRPTQTKGAAMAALQSFIDDGLFRGQQNPQFFQYLRDLAEDADEATRQLAY